MPDEPQQKPIVSTQKKSEDPPTNKKVYVLLSSDYIRKIEDSEYSQTEAIKKGLDVLFSEDYQKLSYYKQKISEYEMKILILEARLLEYDTFKDELVRVHGQLERADNQIDKLREDYRLHTCQTQDLINKVNDERRYWEDDKKQLETKVLLLEDEKRSIENEKKSMEDEWKQTEEIEKKTEDPKKKWWQVWR